MSNDPIIESKSVKKFTPGIAWFFLVLLLICLPGTEIPTPETWLNDIFFDKWVHFGLFGILAFLFFYPVCRMRISEKTKRNILIKIALSTILWGLTTEFIQHFFIPDRSFDLFDWLADSLGILAAFIWCSKRYLNKIR